ncbi:MAG: hypothetical protein EOO46_12855 [Flavobacterium sp.]|nr:MAG: hypothetical protein EOO46_12855 [Flavobacterium sp.]
MKFFIGDIVKYPKFPGLAFIVIASKEQPLNLDFLKSSSGKFNIEKIEKMATVGVNVRIGFDYRLQKISTFKESNVVTEDKYYDVFESDIYR